MNEKELNPEIEICEKIAARAIKMIKPLKKAGIKKIDIIMSVFYCNTKTPLDLEKLLNFDDFNFAHDIIGISDNLDHTTYELKNCFLPRCTK